MNTESNTVIMKKIIISLDILQALFIVVLMITGDLDIVVGSALLSLVSRLIATNFISNE